MVTVFDGKWNEYVQLDLQIEFCKSAFVYKSSFKLVKFFQYFLEGFYFGHNAPV